MVGSGVTTMARERTFRILLLAAAAFLLSAVAAVAQSGNRTPLESLVPTRSAMDIISRSRSAWTSGQTVNSPDNYVMEFSGLPGVTLKRSFAEQTAKMPGTWFDTGISTSLRDELGVALFARTQFQFTREQAQTRDLEDTIKSHRDVRTASLVQAFGRGGTNGSLNLGREEVITRLTATKMDRRVTDTLGLETGLGSRLSFSGSAKRQYGDDPYGPASNEFRSVLGAAVAGGTAKLGFSQATGTQDGHTQQTTQADIATPLRLFGGAAAFEQHLKTETKDATEAVSRITKFSTPLPYRGASFSADLASWHSNDSGAKQGDEQGYNLALPISGKQWSVAYLNRDGAEGGKSLGADKLDLSMPMAIFGAQAALERHANFTGEGPGRTGTSATNAVLPLTSLVSNAVVEYTRQEKAKPGEHTANSRARYFLPLESLRKGTELEVVDTSVRKNDDETVQRTAKFLASLESLQRGASLNVAEVTTHHAGTERDQRNSKLILPLPQLRAGSALEYELAQDRTGSDKQEARIAQFTTPAQLLGLPTVGTYRNQWVKSGNTLQNVDFYNFSAAISGQSVKLFERQRTVIALLGPIPAGGSDPSVDKQLTYLTTPNVHVWGPKFTATANQLRSETAPPGQPGALDTTTNVTVKALPAPPLSLMANFKVDDNHGQRTDVQQVQTTLAVSRATGLSASLDATAPPDKASTIRRNYALTTVNPGNRKVSLTAARTTWEQPGTVTDPGHFIQIKVGDPSNLGIDAQYVQYDPTKWVRFAEPTIGLAVQHGDPAHLAVKLAFEDSEKRVAPRRGLEVALPALGGALKLGFAANPLGPDGKTVQKAKIYDAALEKKRILGSVNVTMKYRFLNNLPDSPTEDEMLRYLALVLDGGNERAGGKVALCYVEGDFVREFRPGADPKAALPASLLDLSYAKQWSVSNRVVLSLRYNTAPLTTPGVSPSTEGRLEYNSIFW